MLTHFHVLLIPETDLIFLVSRIFFCLFVLNFWLASYGGRGGGEVGEGWRGRGGGGGGGVEGEGEGWR